MSERTLGLEIEFFTGYGDQWDVAYEIPGRVTGRLWRYRHDRDVWSESVVTTDSTVYSKGGEPVRHDENHGCCSSCQEHDGWGSEYCSDSYCDCHYDSPQEEIYGLELATKVFRPKEWTEIQSMIAGLEGVDAETDESCGLHVHVGADDLGDQALRRVSQIYWICEPAIQQALPRSRRDSKWCRNMARRWDNPFNVSRWDFAKQYQNDRYCSINFESLELYGTIEFRGHSGTTNPEKIKFWAMFCLGLVEYAKNCQFSEIKRLKSLEMPELAELFLTEEIMDSFGVTSVYEVLRYWDSRILKFKEAA